LFFVTGAYAASVSRTSLVAKLEASERWNPFTAAADAVKTAWNPIDKMRGEMCWDREDMLAHEDCMEWMIDKCKNDNGESKKCQKLRDYVMKHCKAGEEVACKYAKELGMSIAPPPAAPAPAPVAAPSPGPAPSSVPAPAPAALEEESAPAPAAKQEAPAPAAAADAFQPEAAPTESGKPSKLQSQGFEGKKVRHIDGETYASDWRDEYAHPTTTTAAPRSGAESSKPFVVTAIAVLFALALANCDAL